ncbi:MAG: methylmalonyl-CoA mutase family protein [Bacteroidota bacterium]
MKLEEKFNLDEFPIPTYNEWKEKVIEELKGVSFEKKLVTKTYEGIDLNPIYVKNDIADLPNLNDMPGFSSGLRGSSVSGFAHNSWEICQEIKASSAKEFNLILKRDLKAGQTAINLSLDITSINDLEIVFKDVNPMSLPIYFSAGFSSFPSLTLFKTFFKKNGLDSKIIIGSIEADPYEYLLLNGNLPVSVDAVFDDMKNAIEYAEKELPGIRTIGVSAFSYNSSGANAVQELACAFSTAIDYIEEMLKRGLNINTIAKNFRFTFGVGSFFFMEISKLRASRLIWNNILKTFGSDLIKHKIKIHAKTAQFNQTICDPYVNMLRTTTEAFSAVAGGADSIQTNPFDESYSETDEFSRRIARNVQIILGEESHLSELIDPAGGSYYVESLTNELAKAAWKEIQKISGMGGMLTAIINGYPQNEIASIANQKKNDLATRKRVIVGSNMYANTKETLPKRDDRNQKQTIAAGSEELLVQKLQPHRASEIFEELRFLSASIQKKTGDKPKVFLANMGPLKQFKARADFSRGLFEVGGFEVIYPNGFQTATQAAAEAIKSNSKVVVICSSDKTYPDIVPPLADEIKKADSSIKIILAGYPKDQVEMHKQNGVDHFIYLGCNVYDLLKELLSNY